MIENYSVIRILFWNVHRKDLSEQICALVASTNADIVILNEPGIQSATTLTSLKTKVDSRFYIPHSSSEKRFQCFCRKPFLEMSELHSGIRLSVRCLGKGENRLLLALIHGIDMRNYDAETRQSFAQSIADEIRFVSNQQKTKKVVLLGDFNMNPFDRGMNLAHGLNAMMTRKCVASGSRTFLEKNCDFYYNPMWSLLGDNTPGPAGTVYDTSNQGPYGWSMLDQVVIHYSIVDRFQDVSIITFTGEHSLMDSNGRPNETEASDHFPILVTFKGTSNV